MPACSDKIIPSSAEALKGVVAEPPEYVEPEFQASDKFRTRSRSQQRMSWPSLLDLRVRNRAHREGRSQPRRGCLRVAGFDEEEIPVSVGANFGLLATLGLLYHFLACAKVMV